MNKISIDEIKSKAIPILKEAGVTRSGIFGSTARGNNKADSDVDILVDFPKGKSLFDFVGLKLELEDALHRKIDLVEYASIKPRIRSQILNEQLQIL